MNHIRLHFLGPILKRDDVLTRLLKTVTRLAASLGDILKDRFEVIRHHASCTDPIHVV
jgi:hypothetical protein